MDNLVSVFTRILTRKELSNRALALQVGVSHNTIARYRSFIETYCIGEAEALRLGDSGLARLIRNPATRPFIEPAWDTERRKLQSGLSRQEAWREYVNAVGKENALAYRTYCERLHALTKSGEPTMRLVHAPGEAMMVDYAGDRPMALGSDGAPVAVEIFVATLPSSGYTFACLSRTQTSEDWLWANALALEFFGGVPRKIISDNLKAAVLSCPPGKPPKITPSFANFCDHYGTLAAPTRPRKPKDKGSVEAHVKIVQREVNLVFSKLPLMSIEEMNRRIQVIVTAINERPIRRLVTEKRRVLFETYEKAELADLPAERFAFFTEKRIRRAPDDYHVIVDEVAYSVPSVLIRRAVRLRKYHDHIEVWHDGRQVALHQRCHIPGSRVTLPQHQPESHRKWATRDAIDLDDWAAGFDQDVIAFVRAEAERKLSGAASVSQRQAIMRLPREFGREPFLAACRIAVEQGCPTLGVVRNLLENRRHTGFLPDRKPPRTPPHANARGAAYYDIHGGDHA